MFKRVTTVIALAVLGLLMAFSPLVVAQTNQPAPSRSQNTIAEIDRQFMLTASEAGMTNIMMGQLALQQGSADEVKQFAQAEIDEQLNVKAELTRIAPQVGVTLPTAPGEKYQASLIRLSQLSGEQFDQAYLSEGGINAHLENAATFQREAAFGQNPDLIRLANSGLPIIDQHFGIASELTSYRFAEVPQRFNEVSTAPNNSGTQMTR